MPPRPARVGFTAAQAGNFHPSAEPQLALLNLGLFLLTQRVLATGSVVGRVLFAVSVYHIIIGALFHISRM